MLMVSKAVAIWNLCIDIDNTLFQQQKMTIPPVVYHSIIDEIRKECRTIQDGISKASSKVAYTTSVLSGDAYVKALLASKNMRKVYKILRLRKPAFMDLHNILMRLKLLASSWRGITIAEKLAIFLYIAAHGASNRLAMDRFSHSGDTTHHVPHDVLWALVALYPRFVKLPTTPRISSYITNTVRLAPYFDKCLGALDDSHIPAFVSTADSAWYRNRKGFTSYNVLAVCSFELQFLYILAGWEGSAHDARVLEDAMSNHGFHILDGYYYPADAGYPMIQRILVPYRKVRYHLKEQYDAEAKPETPQKLFNLRHAQARNAVERIFGIFKKRFAFMATGSKHKIKDQIKLILVCVCLHNFICANNKEHDYPDIQEAFSTTSSTTPSNRTQSQEYTLADNAEDRISIVELRNRIAQKMWDDYQIFRHQQLEWQRRFTFYLMSHFG